MRMWLCVVAFGVMIGLSWVWDRDESARDGLTKRAAGASGEQANSVATPGGDPNTGAKADGLHPGTPDPLVPPAFAIATQDRAPTALLTGSGWLTSNDSLWPDEDFDSDDRATFHPHGQKFCTSGCTVSNHPTRELTKPLFRQLLAEYAQQPIDETSPGLETLLYYGRQARQFLESDGTGPLDPERAAALRRELSRTHARISIRVVDEHGTVRASLPR